MTKSTLFFGSIGTLVETSEMQRQAFNQAFHDMGLDWAWDVATYKTMLSKSGGQARIEDYAAERGVPVDAVAVHKRKTELFNQAMVRDGLQLRPGVDRILRSARDRDIVLGFVSSTSVENIVSIFKALGDQLSPSDFDFIADGSMVGKGKPAPDIYWHALGVVDKRPQDCVAIEDTAVCLRSALNAGLHGVAFPNAFAAREDFEESVMIMDETTTLDALLAAD